MYDTLTYNYHKSAPSREPLLLTLVDFGDDIGRVIFSPSEGLVSIFLHSFYFANEWNRGQAHAGTDQGIPESALVMGY